MTDADESAEDRFAAYQEMEAIEFGTATVEQADEIEPAQAVAAKLTVEQARAKIGEQVLRALEDKFNGQLTEVRTPDPKDLFF